MQPYERDMRDHDLVKLATTVDAVLVELESGDVLADDCVEAAAGVRAVAVESYDLVAEALEDFARKVRRTVRRTARDMPLVHALF